MANTGAIAAGAAAIGVTDSESFAAAIGMTDAFSAALFTNDILYGALAATAPTLLPKSTNHIFHCQTIILFIQVQQVVQFQPFKG